MYPLARSEKKGIFQPSKPNQQWKSSTNYKQKCTPASGLDCWDSRVGYDPETYKPLHSSFKRRRKCGLKNSTDYRVITEYKWEHMSICFNFTAINILRC